MARKPKEPTPVDRFLELVDAGAVTFPNDLLEKASAEMRATRAEVERLKKPKPKSKAKTTKKKTAAKTTKAKAPAKS